MEDLVIAVKKGEFLFKEGETSKDLYIIKTGTVLVYRESAEGQVLPLAVISAGGFVGEMSFFDGKPRSATAQAAIDVTVIKLETARLESEMKKLPRWLTVMVNSLAARVRDANNLVRRNDVADPALQVEFDRWKKKDPAAKG